MKKKDLIKEIEKLKEDIEELKKKGEYPTFPMPIIPDIPNPFVKDRCPDCGLDLSNGTIMYVCQNPKCPIGLGPIMC